ncbi:MAG: hypothetical protein U9Q21_03470, partial [Candidatus Auribacterota bacterium]|nr:hypothetical protein [Candidatus Auribacterota bacterium]
VQKAMEQYLNKGGALIFYGATMHDRGTMGEHGGVIEWYEYLPIIRYKILRSWRFKPSPDGKNTPLEREYGYINGWHKLDVDKKGWKPIKVPGWWEDHLHRPHDGWGWYHTEFYLNPSFQGKAIILELGRIDDDDSTYVNGISVGTNKGWQNPRLYHIKPGTKAYEKLNFRGRNLITVQVLDYGGGGGMHADFPKIGFETDRYTWQPVNPATNIAAKKPIRHGVISWGPGNFFNSWETSRGVFGFKINGKGVTFNSALAGPSPLKINVKEAFTDFAVSQPWKFEALAFTETHRGILHPDNGERYPCAARVVNSSTKGEFILIPASLTNAGVGPKILKQLKIN